MTRLSESKLIKYMPLPTLLLTVLRIASLSQQTTKTNSRCDRARITYSAEHRNFNIPAEPAAQNSLAHEHENLLCYVVKLM